tara:strand:+ start:215 stop:1513 length:1299 start_codon:yes stop_codon:yes gene_type:complete
MELKMSPSNKDAEKATLGAIMTGGNEIFEKVKAWIREDNAFYYLDNKKLWQSMNELYKEHKPIDLITVNNKIKDLYPNSKLAYYTTDVYESCPTSANVDEYAKIVWYKYVQRASAKTAQKLYNTSFKGNGELTEALEAHSMYIEELLDLHPSKRKEIADIVEDSYDSILNDTNIIQFGIQQLDYFAGGMTRKEITVLGGRPGHGKSTLVINIIRKLIEQGNKVVIFNREMSNEEMMKKILVMESQFLTSGDIRRHTLSDIQNRELEKMKSDITEKYENLIMFDNISGLSEAIREISRIKPDIVIDDYIQLVQVEDDKMERRFQLEKIMHQYKWSAKKNNCHAILVSQLNREIERRLDPRPKMSDFAESGVIEQTAESAMFVFYGWNFNPKTYDENECEIIFAKSRYGKQGAIDMGFNGNRCTYYENIGDASR